MRFIKANHAEPKNLAKFLGLEDSYFYEDEMGPELIEKFNNAKEKQRSCKNNVLTLV